MSGPVCSIDGCERAVIARGVCNLHYKRLRTSGELDLLPISSPVERLAAGLVRMPNGCLEWTGLAVKDGYGIVHASGKWLAHRLAWTLANGPIPPGLCVLHHCDNRPCCETTPSEAYPEGHLFLGTNEDNIADMFAKGRWNKGFIVRPHCPQNHPYDEANTYVSPTGKRNCRACGAANSARYEATGRKR